MSSLDHALPRGITVTRRVALHSAWAVPALWMLSRTTARAAAGGQAGAVEDFLQRWAETAPELLAQGDVNEDALLHRLCGDLARLDPQGFPERAVASFERNGVKSGPVRAAMPFLVIQFDLEPGAVIPAHNHVGWSFVSMGVQGEVAVRHFEPEGDAPDPGKELEVEFRVREVASALLTAGKTSSLTRTRGNIHWFRAGEQGARFLDFGIQFPDPGEGPKAFSAMDFDPEPVDAARRVHTARWIGNIYAKE